MNELIERLRKDVALCNCCDGYGYLPDIQSECGECTPLKEAIAALLALQTQLEKLKGDGHSTAVPSELGARSTASGTPRTDEATRLMQFADAEEQYEVVTSYFACGLERENAALRAQLERVERETLRQCAQIAFDKQMDDDGSDWSEGWNDACTALYNIISGLPSAKTAQTAQQKG